MAQPTTQMDRQSRVLLVDDSDAFLRAAASVVSAANQLQLVGSVTSGEEAIRLLPELKPDLVLLDVHMPGINGVETARIIQRQHPEIVVVLMSATPESLGGTAHAATAATLIDKAELCPTSLDKLLTHRPRDET
jgi:two-component system invasion response regulator UvrY